MRVGWECGAVFFAETPEACMLGPGLLVYRKKAARVIAADAAGACPSSLISARLFASVRSGGLRSG